MNVILYMAVSANGMIAKADDDTSWILKAEWDGYSLMVRTAGCLIVGRRTYHILTKQPEFLELKDVKLVVVSHQNVEVTNSTHVVAHSPQEALGLLTDFKDVIVAGGGLLNASFLSERLVDELYLDIEPILFGNGIPLFHGREFTCQLKWLGQKMLSETEIQLHYQVVK